MGTFTFVGRERELARLQSFLDCAVEGKGQVAFVTGEAGSGKTALVAAFAQRMEDVHPDLVVVNANCNAQGGLGDPYLPFREMLGLLTGVTEARTPRENERLRALTVRSVQLLVEVGPDLIGAFVPGASLVGHIGKFFAQKAGWLNELEKLAERKPQSPSLITAIEQDRIFEQYANVLNKLALEKPLLLIIDDLHWADNASISLLFHLSRRIEASRILIVGTYRPDEIFSHRTDRALLEKILAEIKRYAGDVWIDLGSFDKTEGRAFVNQLIDSEPNALDANFREALFQWTDGHPLFTVELLRTLEDRGNLKKDDQGRWTVGADLDWQNLPARVEGVIEERLGRLDEAQRALLRAASVEGVEFIAEVIATLQQIQLRLLLKELSQNLDKRHRLVHETGEVKLGKQRIAAFQFAHALFQRYLYDELGGSERRLLHGDVARTLEQLYAGQTDEISAQLAWHYERAGEEDKAIDYWLIAGERAITQGALHEAKKFFDRVLELSPADLKRRWRALSGRVVVLDKLAEYEAQPNNIATLIELAIQLKDETKLVEAHLLRAQYAWKSAVYPTVLSAADDALGIAKRTGNVALQARALAWKIFPLGLLGDIATAQKVGREALDLAKGAGNKDTLAFVSERVALIYMLLDEFDKAAQVLLEQVEQARSQGNRDYLSYALWVLAQVYLYVGMGDLARTTAEQILVISQAIGDRYLNASALLTLGFIAVRTKDEVAAHHLYEQALSEFTRMGTLDGRAQCLHDLGLLAEHAINHGSAIKLYNESLEIFQGLKFENYVIWAKAGLARCALAQYRLEEARTLADDIWNYLQQRKLVDVPDRPRAYETVANVFDTLGEQKTAHKVIHTGYADLIERSTKITDLEWRRSYLERVPMNRSLVDRWKKMQGEEIDRE